MCIRSAKPYLMFIVRTSRARSLLWRCKNAYQTYFTPTELREYEDSLKAYRDIKNSLDTAKEQGREEGMEEGLAKGREEGIAKGREEGLAKGRAEGIALVAKMMYDKGMDIDAIASMIGMSKDEVERLCEQ